MDTPEDDVVAGAIGDVQRMTDELLARARRRHPGVEFSIAIDQALSLLLPKTADRIYRTINGRLGYYAGHVYDDWSRRWTIRPKRRTSSPWSRSTRMTRPAGRATCAPDASPRSESIRALPQPGKRA